jgi:hypothetical protein
METQSVVKAEKNLPQVFDSAWGTEGVDKRDILIPKLLVMQGLSDLVTEEKAQMGDIVDSVTGEVLGSCREKDYKPVPVIPIMTFKTWVVFKKSGNGQTEFKEIIPMTAGNENLPREDEEFVRDRCINFYVLNANRTDELPYLLSFRRTSYRAGAKLATYFTKCELAARRGRPVPPAARIWNLGGSKQSNDKGTFYVFDVEQAGETPKEAIQTAFEWYQTLRTQSTKVDHSDLSGGVTDDTAATDAVDDNF